jgi:hypothetical protein
MELRTHPRDFCHGHFSEAQWHYLTPIDELAMGLPYRAGDEA